MDDHAGSLGPVGSGAGRSVRGPPGRWAIRPRPSRSPPRPWPGAAVQGCRLCRISPQGSCSETRCWTSSPLELARRSEPNENLGRARESHPDHRRHQPVAPSITKHGLEASPKSAPPPNHGPGACRYRQLATHCPLGGLDNPPMMSRPPGSLDLARRCARRSGDNLRVLIPCLGTLYLLENLSQVDAGVRPARL